MMRSPRPSGSLRHASELGLDTGRVALGGDSAGGNLATVVSLLAVRESAFKIAYQVLLYPTTDLSLTFNSYRRAGDRFNLTANTMRWFREHYLTGPDQIDDWRASPLRASDVGQMPPALIVTAGCDPLCDEGEAYARCSRATMYRSRIGFSLARCTDLHPCLGFLRAADEVIADVGVALRRAWSAS